MDSGIKAVAFDVDGTLITSSIWENLYELFGVPPERNQHHHGRYVRGEISFREQMDGIDRYFRTLAPLPTEEAIRRVLHGFTFVPGAEEAVQTLKQRGYALALISSGFSDYVRPVAEALAIEHPYAFMHLTYRDGVYGGMGYASESDELTAKVEALKDFGEKAGAAPSEIAFVGDSRNDLAAFAYTGKGILVEDGTPELRRAAWKHVETLPEILDIL